MERKELEEILEKIKKIKSSSTDIQKEFLEDGINFRERYPKSVEAIEAYRTGLALYFKRAGIREDTATFVTATNQRYRGFYTVFQAYLSYLNKHYGLYKKRLKTFEQESREFEKGEEEAEEYFEGNINCSKEELEVDKERARKKYFEHTYGSLIALKLFDKHRKKVPSKYSVRPGANLFFDKFLENKLQEQKKKLEKILEKQKDFVVKKENYEMAAEIRDMCKELENY